MHLNPCSGYLGLVSILLSCCVLVAEAEAHEVWITTTQDGEGRLSVQVHHGHPGDRKTPDADKVLELNAVDTDQKTISLLPGMTNTMLDGMPVLLTRPISQGGGRGIVLLTARYDNGYWVKTSFGYRNTSKRQVADAEDSLYSMKFTKALVQMSSDASGLYRLVVGHRLEMVPLNNPFLLKPGESLSIQVYFDGKALPGSEIECGDGITPIKEQDIPRYRTDQQGIAVIPITRRGPQLFVVDHVESSIHPDLAIRELYNSTLSFVLP